MDEESVKVAPPASMTRWELTLVWLAAEGFTDAQEALIDLHLPGIIHMAQRVKTRFPFADMEDLLQVGRMAILKSAQRYDWAKKCKFFTFATWWLRQAMDREAHRDRLIQFPRGFRERDERCVDRAKFVASLSAFARMGDDHAISTPRGGIGELPPGADLDRTDEQCLAAELVSALPERDRRVVEMVIRDGVSLRNCGKVLGVTGERVRQLKEEVLNRLRRGMGVEQ